MSAAATVPKAITGPNYQAYCRDCGYHSPVVADPETLPAKCPNGCPPKGGGK